MALKAIPNRQIAEEAAEWAVMIDSGALQPADRARLAAWLLTSPVHVDELMLSASLLVATGMIDSRGARSIEALLAEPASEIIPLPGGLPDSRVARSATVSSPPWRLAGGAIGAIAASLVLLISSAFLVLQVIPGSSSSTASVEPERLLETDFGEQRSVALEDGSVLFMNTNSKLRVRFSGAERRVELLRGEALFEVAHDRDRPFRVYSGSTVAQAVGTKFNVRRTFAGISVVVVEGRVLVGKGRKLALRQARDQTPPMEPGGAGDELLILAGDQVEVAVSGKRPEVSAADIPAVTSWRLRKVAFRNKGLDAIADEFNRYNRRKILVADQGLADLRFSGSFDADDPESFVAFLELTAGIEVDKKPGQITLRPAAD